MHLGRLVNVDDGHWPLAYEYDVQDRLITEHQGWGTTRYEYDSVGQLNHCRLPDGSTLDYRHLPGGRLSSIDLNGSRLTSHQFSAGREQQRQQGLLLSQYQYDEQGRLQAHTVGQRIKICSSVATTTMPTATSPASMTAAKATAATTTTRSIV